MNILSDDVKILIRKLAIPASVGTLFQTLYNIVDTFFAGKISPEALAALTKSFPIYFILIASSIGVTVAGTSLIGNSIGEKKFNKASTYFCQLIFFSIILRKLIQKKVIGKENASYLTIELQLEKILRLEIMVFVTLVDCLLVKKIKSLNITKLDYLVLSVMTS